MARFSRVLLATVAVGAASAALPGGAPVGASGPVGWKGAETLAPVALAPNAERCGAPPKIEARYAGTGIDTNGGVFAVTASGCLDLDTLEVWDMEATDRYTRTGDTVLIAPADFSLVLDEASCVATNLEPVPFSVAGGTGAFEGATGSGHFDFALSYPPCGGLAQPAHIWFQGEVTPA